MTSSGPGTKNLREQFSSIDVWAVALLALSLEMHLLWMRFTNYTEEDAFITFRFARQLAAGNGFVYNLGEKLYGTTTPLMTLVLAAWLKFISNNVILGARILDLLAVAGMLFFTWQTLRSTRSSAAEQILPLAALAFSYKLLYMDTQGMEMPLVLCLMAASWYAWTSGRTNWAGLLSGLLLWTRVDLVVWPAALILVSLPTDPKQAARLGILAALVYLPWVIFAAFYFGSPIPFTITAKWVAYSQFNQAPYPSQLGIILNYLLPFDVPGTMQFLVPLTVWMVIVWAAWKVQLFRDKPPAVLFVFIAADVTLLTLTRATFFSRYFIPALWATLILFGLGLGVLWDRLRSTRTPKILFTAALLILLFVTGVAGIQFAQIIQAKQIYRFDDSLKELGIWLNRNSPPQATVLLEPLGYVGYYSNRTVIDEVGLVTPAVLSLKLQQIGAEMYPSIFHPDYIVLHCDDAVHMQETPETGLSQDYVMAQEFNPLEFDPSTPDQSPGPTGLARVSCYQVWQKSK